MPNQQNMKKRKTVKKKRKTTNLKINPLLHQLIHRCLVVTLFSAITLTISRLFLLHSPSNSIQQIKPIDRIHENELDTTTFLTKYVQTGTPLIIIRDNDNASASDQISSFLNHCPDLSVPGIPGPALYVLESLTPFQIRVASFIMKILLGIDYASWIRERQRVTIRSIYNVAKSETSLRLQMSNLVYLLPYILKRVIELFARPPYLGDAVLGFDELQHRCSVNYSIAHQVEELQSIAVEKNDPEWNENKIWLFWGGIDSSYYPMHRDHNDGDVVMDVLSGCKEFVIVHPEERHKLSKIPIPGSDVFGDDLFKLSTGELKTMNLRGTINSHLKRAWKGTISAGETLYMPCDSLHEARNNCPSSISMAHRPWLGKTFRTVEYGRHDSEYSMN